MAKKIKYVPLPLFSIATFKTYIYMAGGGGGKTGIPNQIFIFQRTVTKQPIKRISTGITLYENMIVSLKHQLMICSANQKLLIFQIIEQGKNFNKLYEIIVDQSYKNATINSIVFHPIQKIIAVGGDDTHVRFYKIFKQQSKQPELLWQHQQHRQPIRKIDSKQKDLFVSNDAQVAIVINLQRKQILRKFYFDLLNPIGSVLQSAYFCNLKNSQDLSLILCHYVLRGKSYVTRQLPNKNKNKNNHKHKLLTLQVSTDQSCSTSKQSNLLGIACGQGATYLIDTQKMQCISKQKGHQFVITTSTLTKGRRFITGSSSCSYNIQEQSGGNYNWLYSFIIMIVILVVFGFGFGFGEKSNRIVQEL